MFEQVNNINEVVFEEIVTENFEAKAKAKAKANAAAKIKWRDELIGFGLVNNARFFSIRGGIAPISLAFADDSYTKLFGNSPRVTIIRQTMVEPIFKRVCEQYKLTPILNSGGTIEGYDFLDGKTAQEFVNFLVGFEKAYRKLKNSTSVKNVNINLSERSIKIRPLMMSLVNKYVKTDSYNQNNLQDWERFTPLDNIDEMSVN